MKHYYLMNPEKIRDDIKQKSKIEQTTIENIEFLIYPEVYPSQKFRSSIFLAKEVKKISVNKTICDMGCGIGLIGHIALKHGASRVVQADINSFAVRNAIINRSFHGYSRNQLEIYHSNCFDNIPDQSFDYIIFNIPFHSEHHELTSKLDYAFFDPCFKSTKAFLEQAKNYMHASSQILIAFSSRGNVKQLEELFYTFGYTIVDLKRANTHQKYDSRIYFLKQQP